jgi:UDP-N-acetylmuramate--alanine ligase
MVAEADESDRSFLKLSPVLAVVTNLDREHMDCYRDIADVESAFVEFMDRVPFYGATTACLDNALLRGVLDRVHRRVYTYGESAGADFRLQLLDRPAPDRGHWQFEVNYRGLLLGPFTLQVPGRHNVLNATAAVAIGVQLGVAPDAIAAGLASFRGVDRRFQVRGSIHGITVVDDYGHHPTEILATLRAARDAGYARVHVLFQPHRYTRTLDLQPEFARAFADADTLRVLDIYAASEEPIAGVDSPSLVDAIRRTGTVSGGVEYAESMSAAVSALAQIARAGDVILTLGAGSVSQAGPLLLEALAATT